MSTGIDDEMARELLGLLPAAEFAEQVTGDRRSGRTTSMLVSALVAALAGEAVEIVAYSPRYAKRLQEQLWEMAQRVADKTGQPMAAVPRPAFRLRPRKGRRIFADHYLGSWVADEAN